MGNLEQNPTPLAPPTVCNRTCQNPSGRKLSTNQVEGAGGAANCSSYMSSKLKLKFATWSGISRRYTIRSLFSPHTRRVCFMVRETQHRFGVSGCYGYGTCSVSVLLLLCVCVCLHVCVCVWCVCVCGGVLGRGS